MATASASKLEPQAWGRTTSTCEWTTTRSHADHRTQLVVLQTHATSLSRLIATILRTHARLVFGARVGASLRIDGKESYHACVATHSKAHEIHPSFRRVPSKPIIAPRDAYPRPPRAFRFENEYGCPVDCSDSPNLDVSSPVVSYQIISKSAGCCGKNLGLAPISLNFSRSVRPKKHGYVGSCLLSACSGHYVPWCGIAQLNPPVLLRCSTVGG